MKLKNLLNPFYVYERRNHIRPVLREMVFHSMLSVSNWMTAHGILVDANARKLASLKNIHKGKRGFVIGNGPSLRMDDLSSLVGEITIASNKIYLAFDKTDWRPTYYSIIDGVVAKNISDEVSQLPMVKYFPVGFEDIFKDVDGALFCGLLRDWYEAGRFEPGFSDDIISGIYAGECVTYWNIQILWYLGIREIYLLGVDHSFTLPSRKIKDEGFEYILVGEGENNHFDPNYRPVNELWTMPHLAEQETAYAFARAYIEKRGGVLRNASRRTKLACLDLADFDVLIKNKI